MRPHPSPLLSLLSPNHTLASVPMTAKSLLTFGSTWLLGSSSECFSTPQTHTFTTDWAFPSRLHSLPVFCFSGKAFHLHPTAQARTWGSHLTCSFLHFLSYQLLNSRDSTPQTLPNPPRTLLPLSVFTLLQLLLYCSPCFQASPPFNPSHTATKGLFKGINQWWIPLLNTLQWLPIAFKIKCNPLNVRYKPYVS